MPLVGSEVFGGVATDQPGEPGQYGGDDEFDYGKHSWFLIIGSMAILWIHDVKGRKSNRYKIAEWLIICAPYRDDRLLLLVPGCFKRVRQHARAFQAGGW